MGQGWGWGGGVKCLCTPDPLDKLSAQKLYSFFGHGEGLIDCAEKLQRLDMEESYVCVCVYFLKNQQQGEKKKLLDLESS